MEIISVKVEQSGRILIPATVRRKLKLDVGSEVILRVDDTGILIGNRDQALARATQVLRRYIPESVCLSEELIKDRRAEAKRENKK
jgi:AbrB family looped-hinge helix DNA binding protein